MVNSILVHSDIRGFSAREDLKLTHGADFRKKVIDSAFMELESIAAGREIFLPAFNYDFTSTRLFNVDQDFPQVGRIPVEAMSKPGWHRSHSPVYSFFSNHERPPLVLRPFSEVSLFADLVKRNCEIGLLGVGFESLTFIHHVEHVFNVPYRYSKRFEGEIAYKETSTSVCVEFHVRPIGLNVSYDFEKIRDFLLNSSAARVSSNQLILVSARQTLYNLLGRLKDDPTFLLTEESADSVLLKLNDLGRPMQQGDFE
jgi:aminoglycoside N3'-acetyltransferase